MFNKKAAFLSSFYFFHFGTLGIFIPFVALYLKSANFSGKDIGIFLTIVSLIKFLFTNKWTKVYNNIRFKKVFLILAILVSNLSIILLISKSYTLTFICFVIYSAFRVGILPVMDHISNEFSHETGIEYGRIRLFGSFGFIFFTTIAGVLTDYFSIQVFIFLSIVTGILSAISVLFIKLQNVENPKKSYNKIKLSIDFKIILIASILHYISLTFFHNFLNIKVEYLNQSQTIAGMIWSIGIFTEIVLMFSAKHIFKLVNPVNLLIISLILGSIRSLVIGYANSTITLLIINILHGFAFGTFHLSIIRYIKDYIKYDLRLKAQSYYAAYIYGLATILGSLISGYLYDLVGINMMFIYGSLFSLIGVVILILYRNKFLLKYSYETD